MHYLCRNVNDAFGTLVRVFHHRTVPISREQSRAGEVLRIPEPVIVTYSYPRERVLFNPARDCNPFFHLYEALWMLAGRNDVGLLAYYNPRMREFSDNGTTLYGAYGYRWQRFFGVNQLHEIAVALRMNPDCRRQVLQVWSAQADLNRQGKDLPCNTHAYFSIQNRRLEMTVCNRSNDLIWGMLGANVVHWSILQEYLAAVIGVEVGRYHQVTNNLHVYTERFEPERWLAAHKAEGVYDLGGIITPLVLNHARFLQECEAFTGNAEAPLTDGYAEPFISGVAQPAMTAFRRYKQRRYLGEHGAIAMASRISSPDWRVACKEWIERRYQNWKDRNDANPYTARELHRQEVESRTDKS